MGLILFIIIALGVYILYSAFLGPDAKELNQLCKGKTEDQKKVITYFCRKNNFFVDLIFKKLTDNEYTSMVHAKRDVMNFKQKALTKIGLDEDQVNEIKPAMFEGFVFKNAYAKKRDNGNWVSSAYQVSWVFFSSTQIYLYSYTFNMDEDNKGERTDEFFYKDVTSFSTTSGTETARGSGDKKIEVETRNFTMVVPGDKLNMSIDGVPDAESIIQAMKQKLREKKA